MKEKIDPNVNHSWSFGRWVLMVLCALVFNILAAQVPTEGLVGYWPFNGNANDMSGNGNHGILEGQSQSPQQTSDRFGNPNSAYQFGGYYNKNWIRVPNNSSMQLGSQMTVSLWFQQCEFAGMDGWGNYSTNSAGFTIFSKAGDGHAAYPGLWVHEGVNFQTGVLNINSSNCNMDAHVATNYDINLEYHCFDTCEWVHFVSIIDDTIAKIYLNGILYRDTIINHADYTKANLQDIFIGRMGCDGFVWFPFNGKIDDVLFYNRAITEDEVLQLFGNFYDIHAFDNLITIDSILVVRACNGDNGMAQVFPDSANGPYQYALDYANNFQTSNILQNISPGVHRIYVKSACGLKDTLVDFTCCQPPVILHTPDTVIISGTSADLWVSGADVLYWTDSSGNIIASGPSLTVSPSTSTMYYIAGQNYSEAVGNNLVLNGDFEQGNVGFTSSYNYDSDLFPAGNYYVGPNAHNYHTGFYNWPDHTTGTGNYMIINGAMTPNTNVWTQTVTVAPNTDYAFSTWVCSVGGTSQYPTNSAQLQFSVNGNQLGNIFTAPNAYGVWSRYYEVWNSGNNTSVTLTILNQNTASGGNDFGIDDIVFAPLTDCFSSDSVLVDVMGFAFPDNVDSADCTFLPEGTEWGIGQPIISNVGEVVTVSTPMIGDIDDDGHQEIVISSAPGGNVASKMDIFNSDGSLKLQFNIVGTHVWNSVGLAKVKWDNNSSKTIIVVYGTNNYLYAYDANGVQLWQSDQPFSSHNGETYNTPAISFADFNHDGWSEVYVGSEIFDAATGVLLCKTNGNKGGADRTWNWANSPYQTMAADLCGDSRLELAVGNAVYDIDIQSRTDFSANHVTIASQVPSSSMVMEDGSQIPFVDGNTFLADINLDGSMDVIVMNVDGNARIVYLYVWDVATHTIICSKKITNARKFGMPQIGDLDNDNYPEICFITGTYSNHGTGTNDNIYALKYNPSSSNGAMEVFWSIPHEDNSASTGLTMFDFNQDGYVELIYRDVYNLRIINGSLYNHQTGQPVAQPYDLAYISCCSSTGLEYPVVADVDLDGEVEVVVGGETFYTGFGHLYIFKSAGVPWAPARKVWNQYMYNVTNVNEDLTIPQYLFNNATVFTDPEGVVRRPFNNFLQQATTIDRNGRPFYAVPDVAMETSAPTMEPSASSQMVGDSLVLTFSYCNLGDNTLNAPYPIAVFANTYGGDTVCTVTVGENLPVDSCTQGEIRLPVSALCGFSSLDSLVISVNCAGNGIAQNGSLQPECDTSNNTVAVAFTFQMDTVHLTATACDSYLWYGDMLTQSGEYMHTITCDSVEILHLTVVPLPELHHTPDTVIIFGTSADLWASGADVLYWTDSSGNILASGPSLTVSPATPTMYYITGQNHSEAVGNNLVVNGDFEQGNVGFTSEYAYNNFAYEGAYYIGYNGQSHYPSFATWHDHTSGSGLYMIVNGAGTPNSNAWTQTVAVEPNTDYAFSAWICNLSPSPVATGNLQSVSQLQFSVNGTQLGEIFYVPETAGWTSVYEVWNSGNDTTATITVLNQNSELGGNDFGLDDISFTPLTTCFTTDSIRVYETDYPDNVDSADCVFFPEGTEWSIGEPIVSGMNASMSASVPVVGDVDDDGQQEIVMHTDSKILIFNSNAELKNQFNMCNTRQESQLALAKVLYAQGEYKTIIVAYSSNNYFYAYDANGQLLWQSNQPFSSYNSESYKMPAISFADFNHDGWTEMFAGSEVYDAATGMFLCKTNGNKGHAGRTWESYGTYQSSAADLFGDASLELAVGNTVYAVDLQSRSDASLNQITPLKTIASANMVMEEGSAIPFTDGNTFLVDINLDGQLDVLVMNEEQNGRVIYLYVWDVVSQSILCSKRIPNARKFGMPQIGDIDSDGFPEICFVIGTYPNHQHGNNETIFALKYNEQNPTGEMDVFWTTPHSDYSGATSLTLFDFNQDGYSELVYRDENHLRIINGSMVHHQTGEAVTAPYDLASYACGSGTALEYPIVCDVDQDGAAEIIIASSCNSSSHVGHLYIFKSAGVPWAPARKVWNQYMYNVTNVNEDLTIPQYLFNNATVFTDPEGVVRRPFNNFLQQATTIDQYGRPFYAVPDVAMETSAPTMEPSVSSQMVGDSLVLTFSYCNLGDNTLNAPYPITVFANTYGGDTICTVMVGESLPVDSCTQGEIRLSVGALCGLPNLNSLVVAVNCNGNGIAQNGGLQPECDTTNNTVAVAFAFQMDTIHLTATACDSYLWYGETLTQSGEYTHTQANPNGCDSVMTLHLTVVPTLVRMDTLRIMRAWLPYSFPVADTVFAVDIPDSSSFVWWAPVADGCDTMVMQTVLVYPELSITASGTINTDCTGRNCFYNGPSIMINEVMLAPLEHDGSIAGSRPSSDDRGEWIELYNPHKCDSVDISCYFLGNNANDNGNYGGGFALPPGTIVPPQGFCLVRGVNAPAVPANLLVENGGNVVEVVVDNRYCIGGGMRLWFPNNGGWFAFYDADGVPQDAITWYDTNYSCSSCYPCLPGNTGCGFNGTLPSYDEIPYSRKNYITSLNPNYYRDLSFRRIPDGGEWQNVPTTPTYGLCNAECVEPAENTGNAIAVAGVTGGVPPYTYQWNDPAAQTTDTAFSLTAGLYTVTVTDLLGNTVTATVPIENFVPEVSHDNASFCYSDTMAVLQGLPAGGTYSGATMSGDTLFFEAGVSFYQMTYTIADSNGCTATDTFQVMVAQNEFEVSDTACSNELPLLWNGLALESAGDYTVELPNVNGCDSVMIFHLTVIPTFVRTDTLRIMRAWLPYSFPMADTVFVVDIPDSSSFVWWAPAVDGCDTMVMQTVLVYPELSITASGTINTDCAGRNCFYNGPSIMINEVMLAPQQYDGSMVGSQYHTTGGGEWIELYNPHKCDSVDISCYFLGNNAWDNTNQTGNWPGGFVIPPGSVVPPQGFAMVRGALAAPVPSELLVQNGGNVVEIVIDSRYCIGGGGGRLWFPNAGGWFAFYDANGVPQDAISWASQTNSCMSCQPCNPGLSDCGYTGELPSYNDISDSRKNYISSYNANNYLGLSFRRIPDGGEWQSAPAAPTYGLCNAECVEPAENTGNAIAVAGVTGGVPPYTYQWNDPAAQTTDTAFSLTAGLYTVTVTDLLGNTITATVSIENFVPEVSHDNASFCYSDTMAVLQGLPTGGTYSGATMSGDTLFFEAGVSFYQMTYTIADSNGCTATDTFQVMVAQNEFEVSDTACSNELPLLWNGLALENAGDYTVELPNVNGCDSVVTIHLTVNQATDSTLQNTVLENNMPYVLNDSTYFLPGTYTQMLTNTAGCDSVLTLVLTVLYNVTDSLDTAVCESALPYAWNDSLYMSAGVYTQTFTAANGADSIVTLNLNILPPTDSTLVVTMVENNLPYQLNDNSYTTAGTYTQHLDNAAGCDSLLTLVLTVLYNVTNAVDTTVCAANLPITWHGHTYTAAGTHTNVLTASNGVDSTVTYTLYVDELSASVGSVTHVVCYGAATGAATVTVTGGQSPLSYQWTTAAGTGISTTTSISGCVAGSYTFTVTDQLGCTVMVPVPVNMLNDSMQPGTIASDQEVCSGNEIEAFTGTSAVGGDNSAYQWQISTNNTDWTPAPGNNAGQNYTYPDLSSESFWLRRAWISQNCGTVYSNTVMLTVLPVTHDTITADVCQNIDYQGYGFEVSASEIEQPGEYVFERIQTTGPCDTFFVLLLTVYPEYSTDISDEICEGGGYFAHGFNIPAPATIDVEFLNQTLNLQSVHGCDSTVHLELSVTDTAIRIIPLTTDFCETMSAELMVETSMADYVWSTGEQAPTITVTQPGIYSVTASQGVCQATAQIRVENCQYELYLPNAITPSKGDGLNDYFSIPAYNQLGMDKFEISIFNRWGEQVFYSTDKNFKWNGEYRGQIHQEAIYNYIIHYTDLKGKPHKVIGNIIVL